MYAEKLMQNVVLPHLKLSCWLLDHMGQMNRDIYPSNSRKVKASVLNYDAVYLETNSLSCKNPLKSLLVLHELHLNTPIVSEDRVVVNNECYIGSFW
jgi:hypothetical protein